MTPTEQEIEFFKEAKRIQELWEPKWGDWVYHNTYRHGIITSTYDAPWYYRISYSPGNLKTSLENIIFLPRQGQLQEMLEERGYYPGMQKCRKPDEWWAGAAQRAWDEWPHDTDITIQGLGPTPSIALGRALIEVLDKERVDEVEKTWGDEMIDAEIKRQFPNG